MLTKGDRVRISHPRRGSVVAEVIDARTPGEMPAVNEEDTPIDEVRVILAERNVDQVALFQHLYGTDGNVCFFAMHSQGRGWIDLKGQLLTIEPEAC